MGEPNKLRWWGIRPTDPEEDIPVKQDTAANLKGTAVDSFVSQGHISNWSVDPTTGSVAADTGQLSAGRYDFLVTLSCSVDHEAISIDHRNADNNAHIERLYSCIGAFRTVVVHIFNRNMATNERLRVSTYYDMIGSLLTAIWWTKRT